MTHPLPRLLRALLLPLLLAGTAHAELASHTSFKGEVTAYTYDVMGREVMRTFADGQQVRTTYTATGQVASVTDARGTTTYAYDARDRVIRIDYPDGQWVAYAWDGNGNRTSLSTPTGSTTYAYDDGNRLVQVTDPAGAVTTYGWDEAGNPTAQTLPNGVVTTRAYDDNGQLTEVRHEKDGTLLAKFSYERDEDGRRIGATEVQLDPATGLLHSRTLAWSYDELGRLASETLTESGHTTTTAWTHDEVGNRLSEARLRDGVLLATDRYSYDVNDRLTRAWTENGAGGTVSETVYIYDANGATTEVVRTGGFSRTYAYDAAQRLVGVSDSTGQRISYGYDAEGHRVTKSVQQASTLAQNGSWRYLLDPLAPFTEVVATLAADSNTAETDYRFGAGRIAELTAGQLLYYGEDGHHSVRLITDAQGNVVAHLNYAAFGAEESSVTDDASGAPAASPAFRYTGQQWDGALGEYYLRARTYDPGVGRFTQRDSWQGNSLRPVTLNAYVYADADPVGGWDPSGHNTLSEQTKVAEIQGVNSTAASPNIVANFSGRAANQAGKSFTDKIENAIKDCLKQGVTFRSGRNVPRLPVPGTDRFAMPDFMFEAGGKIRYLEAKTKLPGAKAIGDQFDRVGRQLRAALNQGSEIGVITRVRHRDPVLERRKDEILSLIGGDGGLVTFINGISGLLSFVGEYVVEECVESAL